MVTTLGIENAEKHLKISKKFNNMTASMSAEMKIDHITINTPHNHPTHQEY